MTLVALKAFPYAGQSIAAGERFQPVSAFDETVLLRAKLAVVAQVERADVVPPDPPVAIRPKRTRRSAVQDVPDED